MQDGQPDGQPYGPPDERLDGHAFGSLAIIVVNYGSSDLLRHNLVAVGRGAPGARVVVVDNHTTAAERERVQALCAEHGWHAVLLEDNVGFGSGVNTGVDTALAPDTSELLLLNPDATVCADALGRLLTHVRRHPRDLVAPLVQTPDGRTWSAGVDLHLARGEMRSWLKRDTDADPDPDVWQPWLSGACLVLGRDLWDEVGGFDDDYFLYWEDVDLSRRVLEAGGRLVVDEGAVATHDEGATHRGDTAARAKSGVYYYYNTRNRLLFAAKHLSVLEQRRWRRSAASVGYQVLLQGGRRQFRHPRRTVVPALRGTLDGLRLMRALHRAGR